jgi:hypothetical protein
MIRSPRPVGSVGLGERIVGVPPARSVASIRTSRALRVMVRSKPLLVWRTQLVASSETISSIASAVSPQRSLSTSVANRRAAVTDDGSWLKLRVFFMASDSAFG